MEKSLNVSSVATASDGNKTKEVKEKMSRYKDIVELWKGFEIESSADLESHLENFSVLFAYNSGAIENREITYHDTREIFESGKVSGYSGNLKTLFEISNMKDAYRLMLKWFDEKTPLSLESIKEMHYQIAKLTYDQRRWELGERPGQFKKDDRWGVGRHDIAAPVEEVEANLQEDLDELLRGKQAFGCRSVLSRKVRGSPCIRRWQRKVRPCFDELLSHHTWPSAGCRVRRGQVSVLQGT